MFSKSKYPVLSESLHRIRQMSDLKADDFNRKLETYLANSEFLSDFKKQLNDFVLEVFDSAFFVNAFTDYGIHSDRGFFPELSARIKHKILPENKPDNELEHFMNYLFSGKNDDEWLKKINRHNWEVITGLIDSGSVNKHSENLSFQLYNSIIILAHRLTTIGIDPYLVKQLPEADDNNSPFFDFNRRVSVLVEKHYKAKTLDIDDQELEAVLLSLQSCHDLLNNIKERKDRQGTSLHLTYLIKRAEQHIERLRLLLHLYVIKRPQNRTQVAVQLLIALLTAVKAQNKVLPFVKETTQMLAFRVVSHTSEKGEHYIGFSKEENVKLLRSAIGGGLVVVLLVFNKYFIHQWHLSLFFEGLLFGLNYGLGFVFMHLTHLTLATKQPAMTASYIAKSIENDQSQKSWMVFLQIIRSQFVSLVGNIIIVLPVCFALAWAYYQYFGHSVFSEKTTLSTLYNNHPLLSASLVYAAITGVFLSLSGVIIGYIDNKVVYSNIAIRVLKHPFFIHKLSFKKRKSIADFTEKNLGAILGNLFLGFCLGMTGNFGEFLGLPLDIRHITISAGNYAIALGSDVNPEASLIITVFIGILLIGVINIVSSFMISFIIACQSRGLSWKQSLKVLVGYRP